MSRNLFSATDEGEWQDIPPESIKALCKQVRCGKPQESLSNCAEQLGVSPDAIPECYAYPTHLDVGCLEQISKKDLAKAQEEDTSISSVKQAVMEGRLPTAVKGESLETMLLRREAPKLQIDRKSVV